MQFNCRRKQILYLLLISKLIFDVGHLGSSGPVFSFAVHLGNVATLAHFVSFHLIRNGSCAHYWSFVIFTKLKVRDISILVFCLLFVVESILQIAVI